jgi:hypothetical protein
VCGKPVDNPRDYADTIFGPVHDDCWDSFMDTFEWGADMVYAIAHEGSLARFDLDYNDDDDYKEIFDCLDGWDACYDDGILPFSEAECDRIRDAFFEAIKN